MNFNNERILNCILKKNIFEEDDYTSNIKNKELMLMSFNSIKSAYKSILYKKMILHILDNIKYIKNLKNSKFYKQFSAL